MMPKPIHLIFLFLVLGVLYAEFLPTLKLPTDNNTAYSLDQPLTQNELILSWLSRSSADSPTTTSSDFIGEINLPGNLNGAIKDTITDLSYSQATANASSGAAFISPIGSPSAVPTEDQPFVGDVIPPLNTPLFSAYAKGGSAWYAEGDNVIVKMPDGSFRSFKKSDGSETDWQQDRLNYEPISSPNALENYLKNYHGQVVAETDSWAFVKFPSGGFLKIAKSTSGPFLSQQ